MENVITPTQELTTYFIRDFNDHSIHDFLMYLSMENWEDVFAGSNINIIFNKFLDTYRKIFNMCFKKTKHHPMQKYNPWLTRGIRISCYNKRTLYLSCRNSNDKNLKSRYKRYTKILSNVIKAAKKMYNDELITKSKNRIKTTWEIIKKETGKSIHHRTIEALRINNTMVNNSQEIAQNFNYYFSTVAGTIIENIKNDNDSLNDYSSHSSYLINNLHATFPNIN
jgi:hypothetical protein